MGRNRGKCFFVVPCVANGTYIQNVVRIHMFVSIHTYIHTYILLLERHRQANWTAAIYTFHIIMHTFFQSVFFCVYADNTCMQIMVLNNL